MTAFRITDQNPVYFDLAGNVAAGGYLKFYETGTTTPKDVYGEAALTTNNGSTINLGADGRAVDDIWGDGSYRVRLYASDDTLISEADGVAVAAGDGASIPTLSALKFLTNDGAVMSWQSVREVPDPTGSSGKILGTDGDVLLWQAAPAAPTVPALPSEGITSAANKVVIGKTVIQWGTATAPASGAHTTTLSVTFPAAYASAPFVSVSRGGSICPGGFNGTHGAQGVTGTGFAATFDTNVDNASSSFNITSPLDFMWLAIGTVA